MPHTALYVFFLLTPTHCGRTDLIQTLPTPSMPMHIDLSLCGRLKGILYSVTESTVE